MFPSYAPLMDYSDDVDDLVNQDADTWWTSLPPSKRAALYQAHSNTTNKAPSLPALPFDIFLTIDEMISLQPGAHNSISTSRGHKGELERMQNRFQASLRVPSQLGLLRLTCRQLYLGLKPVESYVLRRKKGWWLRRFITRIIYRSTLSEEAKRNRDARLLPALRKIIGYPSVVSAIVIDEKSARWRSAHYVDLYLTNGTQKDVHLVKIGKRTGDVYMPGGKEEQSVFTSIYAWRPEDHFIIDYDTKQKCIVIRRNWSSHLEEDIRRRIAKDKPPGYVHYKSPPHDEFDLLDQEPTVVISKYKYPFTLDSMGKELAVMRPKLVLEHERLPHVYY